MDRPTPDWRSIDDPSTLRPPAAPPSGMASVGADQRGLIAAAAIGLLGLVAAAAFLTVMAPRPELSLPPSGTADGPFASGGVPAAPPSTALGLVVDVAGGVLRPGVYELPSGSRVADAIAAAGGFGPQADAHAVGSAVNLAAPLSDGQKVQIPQLGDAAAPGGGGAAGSAPPAAGGLIDLNSASQAELEELPGIGPVTAQKIIAARETAPFSSVDELLEREVLGPATLEKIRPLVVVGS